MYELNFSDTKIRLHFIGIGGISMSGIAELLLKKGFSVAGSDQKASGLTNYLESLGAKIYIGQASSNISDDVDLVVMTAAIREDNPELAEARRRELPILTRAELLGQIMKQYPIPVAVSGTHGKTTTTSMLSELMLAADMDPTLSIGGILKSIGGNFRIGNDNFFVTEACEYTNSFLSFFPKVEIILNVDADHLDFFKDLDDIRNSFARFARLLPEDGILIVNGEIENLSQLTEGVNARMITFGLTPECDFSACDITFDEMARPSFTLLEGGQKTERITLGVTGIHNVVNSLSVIAFARIYGIETPVIQKALKAFQGTERRFEYKGQFSGVTVIDDYAHHPTEITATLNAAQSYPHKTLWCIFQPHTYTRTKALMDDFASALSLSDRVILADIYAARETDTLGISSADLADRIEKLGKKVYYLPSFEEIEAFAKENCETGDVLITMGAGDVVKIGENLLKK